MGQINVEGAMIAQTTEGVRIPNARCFVYHDGKDLLARLYSDADLTNIQANPMIADENGEFSDSHAVDGVYRLVVETPRGALLSNFESVEVLSGEVAVTSAAALAQRWAEEEEDVIVTDGLYSARHHAAKAAAAETLADTARSGAEVARTQAELAATAAGAAIHVSVAAGLAATAPGDVFLVSTTPGMRTYLNDAGSGSLLGWLGEVLYDGVGSIIASAETGFVTGTIIRVREGGYEYEVASSGASNHHLTTAGGVKLYVKPGSGGRVDIRAFGATGNPADDQDAAAQAAQDSELPIFIPANFVLAYSTPLVLRAPWVGAGKGQGLPGSASDSATAFEKSELLFTGTGWAVTTRARLQNLSVRADISVPGQNGIKFLGAGIGQIAGPVRVMEFDGTGIEIGGSVEQSGIFFADITALEVNNNARLGTLGLHVIGGGTSSANANIFTGTFISGPWETYLKVQGNNNTFLNCDVNPKPSLVSGLGGTLDAGVIIEGDGNTFINPYFEPTPNEAFDCLVRFAATASSNKIERLYTPSAGNRLFSLVEDLGTANEVTVVQIGENFTPSIGIAYSEDNLIPNPGFVAPEGGTVPYGWARGGGSTGVAAVDTSVVRGGKRTLRLSTAGTREQAVCNLHSSSSLSVRNALDYVPVKRVEGQTISVGVWCLSGTEGVGAVKVTAGGGAYGVASHSGSGEWEFLTVRSRMPAGSTELAIALRNSSGFANTTGDCWFSEPVMVIGHDVPRYAATRKLDAEKAITLGGFSWNPPAALPVNDGTPSVADASLFVEANTVARTITNFDDGREGQELILVVTSANTTLANNGNIQTTTDANKALSQNRTYRLVRANGKWWEIG